MLSAVIPLYSEEESIKAFYEELIKVLRNEDYEIIFVDDGSTDKSLDLLKDIGSKDKNVRIYSFRKNQGKAEALTLGFKKAKGDLIVTLDADLQDKPSEIEKLLKKQKEGWDLVSGWRKNRKDSITKIISSKLFNLLSTLFWGLKVNDLNCGLKLYTNDAAKSLTLYGGMHRFIPLLVHQEGFKVTEVPVIHSERKFGKSKYSFSKIFKDIPDMFTMLFLSKYSERPLHFFGMVGGLIFLIGVIILIYLSVLHFQGEAIGNRPLLLLGILMIIAAFQVFFTGFLADLFLHINQKTNGKSQEENVLLKYQSE